MKERLKFIIAMALACSLAGCFITKIPTVKSYEDMPSRKIEPSRQSAFFPENYQQLDTLKVSPKNKKETLVEFLEESNTTAFLVIKKNEIIYEWYVNDTIKTAPLTSFSIAKSVLSALVGIAISEGKIASEEEKVSVYFNKFDTVEYKDLTIKHLLQMTSGIRYSETDVFHTTDESKIFEGDKLRFYPGQKFEYWSATYQLLGLVLQEAIKPQTISSYMSEKIWQPMGAQSAATWSVDNEDGVEKTFCCIQALPIDYARFGSIYLNDGKYNDLQIVPKDWVKKSIEINTEEGSAAKYNYGWWLPFGTENEYLARGFRGQRVFMNQEKQTVIVRLGENRAGLFSFKWSEFLRRLNQEL
jgi:CubicO group peptidase (beta-lactamase class C family)